MLKVVNQPRSCSERLIMARRSDDGEFLYTTVDGDNVKSRMKPTTTRVVELEAHGLVGWALGVSSYQPGIQLRWAVVSTLCEPSILL